MTPSRLLRTAATMAGVTGAGWAIVHETSTAVRRWRQPTRSPLPSRPLRATGRITGGADDPVVMLLHGITGSGRTFGADYDALPVDLLVPDLLGFGRSMAVPTRCYDIDAHIDALTGTLVSLGVADRPLVVAGHSMGAVVALHLAARWPSARAVVAMSAPLYDHEDEALGHIQQADPLARLIAIGGLAERICRWMCDHRHTARWLWPIAAPRYPLPIAIDGVLHTWPAYRQSLQHLVLDSGYRDALATLGERGIPTLLIDGEHDGVPVRGRATALAAEHRLVHALAVPQADHRLPMTHATVCRSALTDVMRAL